jgi:hypothetical protein
MPLWHAIAHSPDNVAAVLQLLIWKVTDTTRNCVPVCKSVLFTLYSSRAHREFIILSITRYFLRVLRRQAGQWSRDNLRNRVRGSRMLSVLENLEDESQREARGRTAAHTFDLDEEAHRPRLRLPPWRPQARLVTR